MLSAERLPAYIQLIEVCNIVDGVSHNLSENRVLPVQVGACIQGDEKLTAVCVGLILISTGYKTPVHEKLVQESVLSGKGLLTG